MNLLSRTMNSGVNLLRKTRNAMQITRSVGMAGLINVIRNRLVESEAQDSQKDLLGKKPMFRYATCNDLITLMAKYPAYCRVDRDSDKSQTWGLKAMGTLFCADRIIRFKPGKALEIGAGWNRHFDDHFGSSIEYWMIDDASDIGWDKESREKFESSMRKRKNTHFVQGQLGDFLPGLPDGYFDLVFSISVNEHVPPKSKNRFYKDMSRVLKPGGIIAHSIDIADEYLGRAEFEAISQAGFLLPRQADLKINILPNEGSPTLFEDFGTVFHGYLGLNRPDKWDKPKMVTCHYPTILVFAYKPEA